jgi:hypothetical protein
VKTFTSLDGLDLFNLSTVFVVCDVGQGNLAIIKLLALKIVPFFCNLHTPRCIALRIWEVVWRQLKVGSNGARLWNFEDFMQWSDGIFWHAPAEFCWHESFAGTNFASKNHASRI